MPGRIVCGPVFFWPVLVPLGVPPDKEIAMSRVLKYVSVLVATIVALFVAAAVVLILFFDPNDFRSDIADAVRESTGRDFAIEGDVTLSLFPWLAVEVGNAKLGNAPGFGDEPFAAFDRAQVGVRLLPLLFGQEVRAGAITVDSLVLNLAANRQGAGNWEDFAAEEETEAEVVSGDGSGTGELDVAGISFTNATIRYYDAATDSRYALAGADFGIGPIRGDADSMSIGGISLRGVVEGVASMPTELRLETGGIDVAMGDETVTVQPVEFSLLGIDVEATVETFSFASDVEPVAQIKVAAFSPRSVMHQLDIEPPVTADPSALSNVFIDATAVVGEEAVELKDVNIKFDDTTFTGSLSAPMGDGGTYRVDLEADRIDLARYMEPSTGETPDEDVESVPVEIPADLIRPINARGNLKVATATLGDIEFSNVVLGLNIGDGRLRLHPISAGLFGGKYNGDVRIDAAGNTPSLSVDEKIDGVNLADLAAAMFEQDNITGTISGAFKLNGRGADMAAVQRNLNGNMSFELKDGTYEGTDIWYELRRARARLKGTEPPEPELPPRTKFSSVTATGVVTNGVMRNNDLFAELPFMQLTGGGTVDIAAATVDYGLTARILERPESLTGVTQEELDDFTEAEIPLKITGSLESPTVRPDVEKLLKQKVEEEVEDLLKDKLKDIFNR